MTGGLNHIVSEINARLTPLFAENAQFAGYAMHGLTSSAYRNDQVYPMLWSKAGDGSYTGVDDISPLILYHKTAGINVSLQTINTYGDHPGKRINRYNMSMYLYHDRQRTDLEADELFLLIQSVFPTTIRIDPFDISLSIKNVVLNTLQVFRSEYTNVEYFVKPEHALSEVQYTIESTFRANCFNPLTHLSNMNNGI